MRKASLPLALAAAPDTWLLHLQGGVWAASGRLESPGQVRLCSVRLRSSCMLRLCWPQAFTL